MQQQDGRYSRQERLAGVGEEGQKRISASRMTVVGCGALGTAQAELLVRAGVGHLRIVDRDFVELSNLQRQLLFDESDARDALPKAIAARKRLLAINSSVGVEAVVADLTPENANDLLDNSDIILDGTDNFETRYLINDYAVSQGRPWIYGAAVGTYGIKMAMMPGDTACFRCVYPEPPGGVQPTCETAGVFGPVTASIAALQSSEALKFAAEGSISGAIVTLDLWDLRIRQVGAPARDPDCPCCVHRQFEYLDGRHQAPISLCGRNAVQIHERRRPVDLPALARQLESAGQVRFNEFALRASIDSFELTIFPDGRAIIKGTTDTGVARSLYSRYIGS